MAKICITGQVVRDKNEGLRMEGLRLLPLDSKASHGNAVILGKARVASRREHDGADGALQQSGHIGMTEERHRLVEGVARLDIGEDEHVGLAVDGRDNALDCATALLARSLHVERPVDDHVAKLTRYGTATYRKTESDRNE